jgi:hypothetical protein
MIKGKNQKKHIRKRPSSSVQAALLIPTASLLRKHVLRTNLYFCIFGHTAASIAGAPSVISMTGTHNTIGVHYPEFSYERKMENVKDFVRTNDIRYPVVLDNDAGTWNAYKNRYWPHRYLIDPDGNIIFDHIGEGKYAETAAAIENVLYNK